MREKRRAFALSLSARSIASTRTDCLPGGRGNDFVMWGEDVVTLPKEFPPDVLKSTLIRWPEVFVRENDVVIVSLSYTFVL